MRDLNGTFAVAIHRKKLVILGVTQILFYNGEYCFVTENTAFARCYKLKPEATNDAINLETINDIEDVPEEYEVIDGRFKKTERRPLGKSLH